MKIGKGLALAALIAALPLAAQAAPVDFTDTFTGGASAQWNSYSGDWFAHDGVYEAAVPDNEPLTISTLGFDFVGSSLLTLTVDVNSLGDGGLWLSSDGTNQNGVLLVLGGNGFGPSGGTGGGHDLYWHVVHNGGISGQLFQASNVFTPGQNYQVKVTVLNGVYNAYVGDVLKTTLTDATFTHGRVGLYDEWGPMTFDNVHVVGETGVPEPASWALMIAGCGLAGAMLRRRREAFLPA
jgi:hypothetical protein